MVKKISMLALAGMIALPGIAAASAGKAPSDLNQKIDELSRQLDELKAQLAKQNEALASVGNQVEDMDEKFEEKSDAWDLAARIQLYGDLRTRFDYMSAETAPQYTANQITQGFAMALAAPPAQGGFGTTGPYSIDQIRMAVQGMKMFTPEQRAGLFQMLGFTPVDGYDVENETMMTNRLRLSMQTQVTENVNFKGRLAMYKAWGNQNNPAAPFGSPYTLDSFQMDGNATRQPNGSGLYVDRAIFNWTSIADLPIWLSVGRRPTTDGPPAHIRLGTGERMASPIAYMDYAFDGATLGYAYNWGIEGLGAGRVRFCYGRGFEAGLSTNQLNDMDFAGFNIDVLESGYRFLNVQMFEAFNIVNTPDGVTFPNPLEMAGLVEGDGYLDKANLGNIYHSTIVYMDRVGDLNYFLAGGWSRTDPEGYDELGNSLLGSWWDDLDAEDGFSFYAGVRYDLDDLRLKLGAEYNYGSQYWISMSPGHDDLYNSKLATRGHVGEVYMLYDLPAGEALSRYAKFFMRLGYQYYKYDYTGSGSWLGAPVDVDDLSTDPLTAQFYPALDDQSQVYLTFEVFF
ncbi:MAG: DUF3373 family protein [Desulfobulbaceae bacterium]|nr:DUF3373 family protein [Desulfobulbaceae bacterium]